MSGLASISKPGPWDFKEKQKPSFCNFLGVLRKRHNECLFAESRSFDMQTLSE